MLIKILKKRENGGENKGILMTKTNEVSYSLCSILLRLEWNANISGWTCVRWPRRLIAPRKKLCARTIKHFARARNFIHA